MNEMLLDTPELPAGFRAAAVAAGLKSSGDDDMALLVSDRPATAAGVFTTHRLPAACVRLSREHLQQPFARALVVNSGNANACTGARGMRDAREMAVRTADALEIEPEQVLVCSTGRIGRPLPMTLICDGIVRLAGALDDDPLPTARAIMTTDTRPKVAARRLRDNPAAVTLTGLAKGAGMIEPHMATMLAFLMTDAAVPAPALDELLHTAVDQSFNRISVDGDMSTNDTVLLLANGASGVELAPGRPGWESFARTVAATCRELAEAIVVDAEGASKVVTLQVRGASSHEQADRAVRAIARSLLVKTSWDGNDANWGRVLDVLGYCGVDLDEQKLALAYDGLPAVTGGLAAATPQEQLNAVVASPRFTITADLGVGAGEADLLTCECSEAYVRINR